MALLFAGSQGQLPPASPLYWSGRTGLEKTLGVLLGHSFGTAKPSAARDRLSPATWLPQRVLRNRLSSPGKAGMRPLARLSREGGWVLGFTAELPGARGIPASSVQRERLSGSHSAQGGCTPCQCISGLAAHGGGKSRFMKSAGRSQLLLAKSRLDGGSARLPGAPTPGCAGRWSPGAISHPGTRL